MIKYSTDVFGLFMLPIWHGSAVWRAFIPACVSTAFLFVYGALRGDVDESGPGADNRWLVHPYAMTVFVAFFSFLLVFRLNFSYQRYWEAATEVHKMTSKWLDSAILIAAFHYQCQQHDDVRPLTFGAHPHLINQTRERESTIHNRSLEETEALVKEQEKNSLHKRSLPKSRVGVVLPPEEAKRSTVKTFKPTRIQKDQEKNYFSHPDSKDPNAAAKTDEPISNKRNAFASGRAVGMHTRGSIQLHVGADAIPVPSLFLQEAAHLYSLLSAVAMSALRNDVEGVQLPLTKHVMGQPFPPVNPDELSFDIKREYLEESRFWSFLYFVLGMAKSPRHRTLYNAARPFPVLGGVSDHEMRLLQAARGPHAKMALVTMWLKEFISREYLNGSTGKIAPPIVGRLYQFVSDGVVGYNQCRKIAFVPFPFPHAQITVFFVLVVLFACPVIFWSFVNDIYFACVMNFVTVLCFCGSHEVARELENPYCTVPNDLPLNNFQAQYNESLLCMYAGFHPDSWTKNEEPSSSNKMMMTVDDNDDEEPTTMIEVPVGNGDDTSEKKE